MVEVGGSHGVPAQVLLRGSGLTPAELHDEGNGISADQEIVVVRNLLAHCGEDRELAVEVGRGYTLGNAGFMGFATMTSPTMRSAIETGLTYIGLTSTLLRYRLEEHGDEAALVLDGGEIPDDVREFVVERDLTALLGTLFPTIFGTLIERRLELTLSRAAERRLAPFVPPGMTTRRGAARNAAVFPRDHLDRPMPHVDAQTARLCALQCEEQLQRRRRRTGIAHRVRVRLLRDPTRMPSAHELAHELNVDTRTLRRRLDAEGTSFRELRDEVRGSLAAELLGDCGLTVTEVAGRLGYAETSTFSHAFKRWHGVSPRTFQQGRIASRR